MHSFPPQPPEQPRRFRLHLLQWIGIPILMLLPLLALLGVFGREETIVRTSSSEVLLEVSYSSRLWYKQNNPMAVTVTNTSGRLLNNVSVRCDSAYFATYSNLTFIPDIQNAYVLSVESLAPGEHLSIRIDGQPEKQGRSTGYITVYAGNEKSATVTLETFVFP